MNRNTLTTGCGKVDQYLFGTISSFIGLIECEYDRYRGAGRQNYRGSGREGITGARTRSSPEWGGVSQQTCTEQDQILIISRLMTFIMVPLHENVLQVD